MPPKARRAAAPVEPADPQDLLATDRGREILDAAAELFFERGYASTTTADIAHAVGMLKGSLYYYIQSKEDLLFAILLDVHRGEQEALELVAHEEGTPVERIRKFIAGHVKHLTANIVKCGVYFHDFHLLTGDRRKQILAARDQYESYLRQLIELGQKDGSIRTDVTPTLASLTVFGALNWTYQWYREGGRFKPDAIANAFSVSLLEGLQTGRRSSR